MSHQLASINLEWLVTVLWSVEVFLIHYFKYLKLVNEGNRCLLFCWVALFLSLFADNEIASICRLDQLKCLNTLGMITWNDWFQENGFILGAICLCHHFVILCSLYKLRSVKTTNTHIYFLLNGTNISFSSSSNFISLVNFFISCRKYLQGFCNFAWVDLVLNKISNHVVIGRDGNGLA